MAGETRTTRGTPLSPVMARSPSSPHPPGAGAALGGLRPLTAAHPRKVRGKPAEGRPPPRPQPPAPGHAQPRSFSQLRSGGERSGGTPPVLPPHPAHRRLRRRGGCHPPAPPHGSTYRAGGGPRAPAGPALAGHHVSPPPQRSAPHTSAPAAAPVGNRSAVTGATAAPGEPRACPACPRRRRRVAGTRQAVRSREATASLCCPSAVPRCLPREPCWAPAARRGGLR